MRQRRFAVAHLPITHLTDHVRLFPIAHHRAFWTQRHGVVWSLPLQAGLAALAERGIDSAAVVLGATMAAAAVYFLINGTLLSGVLPLDDRQGLADYFAGVLRLRG